MGKPIFDLGFWKERIEGAKKGREHYSVYVTHDADWDKINKVHKEIIGKEVKGRVLDAGCGYGRTSEWLENYVGVDFSPDFIEIAKKKYPHKEFVVSDLRKLPFKDGEFDWAVCISIKEMVQSNMGNDEWVAMEKELLRVSKHVLILEYTSPDNYIVL